MGFCIVPALAGVLIIIFSITNAFSEDAGIYSNLSLVLFWVFIGLVLIAHTTISVINLCKC